MTDKTGENRKMSLGIVGGGEGAAKAISAIKGYHSIQIVSIVCRPDELMGLIDSPIKTNSYDILLRRDDINTVYIATPNNTHVDLALKALDAGKHVIIEKPLSHTFEEAHMLLSKVKPKPVAAVAFKKRFGSAIPFFKDAVSNTKGNVKVSYKWYLPAPTKSWLFNIAISGGGIIMDLGSHVFDLFEYIFGEILSVHARIAMSKYFPDIEEYAFIDIEFRSGFKGEIELSWLSQIADQCLTIEINSRKLKWKRVKKGGKSADIFEDTDSGFQEVFEPAAEYRNFLDCFYKRALGGREEIPLIEAGLRNLQIINAAYHSSKLNRKVIVQ